MNAAEKLYTECMNCPKTERTCPGVWKDIPGGIPPRGFRYHVAPIDLLVVAKNPGHPLIGEQDALRGKSGIELVRSYREFQDGHRANGPAEPSNRFHKNLRRYLEFFLDCEGPALDARIASTNLVKCSTRDERARLNKVTMKECYEAHLKRELLLFRPKVILALGNEVRDFLGGQSDIGVTVIGVKHPSYFYRRDKEREILLAIKERIHGAITEHRCDEAEQHLSPDVPASAASPLRQGRG